MGDPRSVSYTRWWRKCESSATRAVDRLALAAPLCIGCPFLRNGPISLPYRSCSTSAERTRLGTLSEPRAYVPWQSMHSAAHTFLPRSAAAASTTCLLSAPAVEIMDLGAAAAPRPPRRPPPAGPVESGPNPDER